MTPTAMGAGASLGAAAVLAAAGALASAGLIVALRPWLLRYALARPSARGLHRTPTPQGGGIAVLLACAGVAAAGAWWFGLDASGTARLAGILAAALGLALVGLVDDIRPLPALPRLLLQLGLMAVGVALLPEGTRVLPFLPLGFERAILVLGGAWFVNLTNFMDGMDWLTVTEMVPLSAVLALFWLSGDLPAVPGLLALGLLAGLIGYAPFNRPVASLFLGDVGSLPIGFLVAYGLFSLAGSGSESGGALSAAVLLPLYYIADSGITLVWRLARRERVWTPHRSHYYQVAVLHGLGVPQVLRRVLAANVVLAGLAWASLRRSLGMQAVLLGVGAVAVAILLAALTRPVRSPDG